MKHIDPIKAWWFFTGIGILLLIILQLAGIPVD